MKRLVNKRGLQIGLIILVIANMSCTALNHSTAINIDQMDLQPDPSGHYESYVQSIREGGVQINGNNNSGGCGCN